MIKGKNLSKNFGKQLVFSNSNIEANFGDFIGIIGKTGCGKSTLLNILSGYDTSNSGQVEINGKDTSRFKRREVNSFRNNKIAFLFQDFNLFEDLTVFENLKLSVNLRSKEYHKIDEYLTKLNLEELKHKRVSKLSGGEKQRIAFLRAIIKNFDILICDEPTGNLDDTNSKLILDLIKEECKDKIVIMVTHKKSISNSYFNKKYSYNREEKYFEKVLDENINIEVKEDNSKKQNFSILGIIKHATKRFKNNLFFNALLLMIITTFIVSFSSFLVIKNGMFREIQLDKEKVYLPLDELIVDANPENLDYLLGLDEVESVSVKSKRDLSYKSLGRDYTISKFDWSDDTNPIYKINIVNEGKVTYTFLSSKAIASKYRSIEMTKLDGIDSFPHANLIVGEYPKEGQILVDVSFAFIILQQKGFSRQRYLDNVVSIDKVFKAINGQYLEFYTAGRPYVDESGSNVQDIQSLRFKVSGIIDSRESGEYLSQVYADQNVIDKISGFMINTKSSEEYVVYKKDATRTTHEKLINSIDKKFKYDTDLMTRYIDAYTRVKKMVDYNIYLTFVATLLFFVGFTLLVIYIFSANKYEIAIYKSLGVSNFYTTFILGLNYIILVLIGIVMSYLLNLIIISKALDFTKDFARIFEQGILVSSAILIGLFFIILLYFVNKYSKKSINSII